MTARELSSEEVRTERITLPPATRPLPRRAVGRARRELAAIYWRRRFAAFGRGSSLASPSSVWRPEAIAIGSRVAIWPGSRLEALGNSPEGRRLISIGDGCSLQTSAHIAAVRSVTIGSNVLVGSYVHITDHDHEYGDPDWPPILNRQVRAAPVAIGDGAWLGDQVIVLRGVSIGAGVVVGAASVVTRDVAPYTVVVGAPAKPVRRYDFERREWARCERG